MLGTGGSPVVETGMQKKKALSARLKRTTSKSKDVM